MSQFLGEHTFRLFYLQLLVVTLNHDAFCVFCWSPTLLCLPEEHHAQTR